MLVYACGFCIYYKEQYSGLSISTSMNQNCSFFYFSFSPQKNSSNDSLRILKTNQATFRNCKNKNAIKV